MEILWQIGWGICALALLFVLVLFLYIKMQGEEGIELLPERRSKLACNELSAERAVFSLVIPYFNPGSQDGIVLDAFARVLLPAEQFSLGRLQGKLERVGFARSDDYMEAFIVPLAEGGELKLTLALSPQEGSLQEALAGMVDVTIDVYLHIVGRSAPRIEKYAFTVLLEEFQGSAAKGGGAQ